MSSFETAAATSTANAACTATPCTMERDGMAASTNSVSSSGIPTPVVTIMDFPNKGVKKCFVGNDSTPSWSTDIPGAAYSADQPLNHEQKGDEQDAVVVFIKILSTEITVTVNRLGGAKVNVVDSASSYAMTTAAPAASSPVIVQHYNSQVVDNVSGDATSKNDSNLAQTTVPIVTHLPMSGVAPRQPLDVSLDKAFSSNTISTQQDQPSSLRPLPLQKSAATTSLTTTSPCLRMLGDLLVPVTLASNEGSDANDDALTTTEAKVRVDYSGRTRLPGNEAYQLKLKAHGAEFLNATEDKKSDLIATQFLNCFIFQRRRLSKNGIDTAAAGGTDGDDDHWVTLDATRAHRMVSQALLFEAGKSQRTSGPQSTPKRPVPAKPMDTSVPIQMQQLDHESVLDETKCTSIPMADPMQPALGQMSYKEAIRLDRNVGSSRSGQARPNAATVESVPELCHLDTISTMASSHGRRSAATVAMRLDSDKDKDAYHSDHATMTTFSSSRKSSPRRTSAITPGSRRDRKIASKSSV